jgi:Tol biopolymer transport system component
LLGTVDAPVALRNPSFLPNQRGFLAASNGDAEHKGLWTFDVDRTALTRVATEGMRPFASPDGRQIVFTSDRNSGVADMYVRPIAGRDGDQRLLLTTSDNKFICDWSPDGRYIVYGSTHTRTRSNLWLLPLFDDRQPRPYLQTPSNEICGQVSPDGHWLAYASDETGTWEVYVQAFPEPGSKQTISAGGGVEPHWRGDGRELFYLAGERNVTGVAVTPGLMLGIGARTTLFRAPLASFDPYLNRYAVTADGQRFVIHSTGERKRDQDLLPQSLRGHRRRPAFRRGLVRQGCALADDACQLDRIRQAVTAAAASMKSAALSHRSSPL